MSKFILFLTILTICFLHTSPCTTFVLKDNDNLVFGRNLDWLSANGIIVENKRNVRKSSLIFPPDKPITWISKYGSLTFNQFGKEFPFGGMNEKGLVVEIMKAPARYPLADNRPAVNELQWIQYQLDNAATIDEVIESDKTLRISEVKQELHYLICDKSGNAVVIEFINNKMMVYRNGNLPFPVLENNMYAVSLDRYKRKAKCRFKTTVDMLKAYNAEKYNAIDYSFRILDEVALSGEWSVVYDINNMQIHFKTSKNRNVSRFDFSAFGFDCETSSMIYDLQSNNRGLINKYFIPFNPSVNNLKMRDAMQKNEINFPQNIAGMFYEYHKNCICQP